MSCFATSRRFIRVQRGQQVEHACRGQKPCSVVAIRTRNIGSVRFERSRYEIKTAGAQIGDVSERIESVIPARSEKVSAHSCAYPHKHTHSEKADHGPAPHFQQGMAQTGHKPTRDADNEGERLAPGVLRLTHRLLGCCLLSHFSSLPSGKVFFFHEAMPEAAESRFARLLFRAILFRPRRHSLPCGRQISADKFTFPR